MLRLLVLLLTLSLPAYAAGLFSATVTVKDNSAASELEAKKQGLAQVLIRASGQPKIVENPTIKKAIADAGQYVTQLGYNSLHSQPQLILTFDQQKIRTLLQQTKTTYWGEPRPEVLFWIIEDSTYHRGIVWEQSGSQYIKDLKAKGVERGLPVLVPIGDFDDVIAVPISDLWGGVIESVRQGSLRYHPAGVAIVKLADGGLTWQLYPTFEEILNELPVEGEASGEPNVALPKMVDDIANYYAEQQAINLSMTEKSSQLLEVYGISSSNDFFALERMLKSLTSLSGFSLVALADKKATFRIALSTPVATFEQELSKQKKLVPLVLDNVEQIAPASTAGAAPDQLLASNSAPASSKTKASQPKILAYQWQAQ